MDSQLTVRLPADLNRALRSAAKRTHRKAADIVRLALREYLGADDDRGVTHADRVRHLIGSLDSGEPDLAQQHRARILESLRRGR